ncbi:CGNR zinc finger domain-containing protein [Pelagibius sp.]|uniref:CGNR zinc finger domain-containing protein n=1 Tax=Pelagibius sp. TaxID=1931238 RepID=UPI002627BDAA|nr:CGNR zinc finger domain-containing protein [Pelagibius sp.]
MSYASHPVRLCGERLILDFLNTADWAADGEVVHEKLATPADVDRWMAAAGLDGVAGPKTARELARLKAFRAALRATVLKVAGGKDGARDGVRAVNTALRGIRNDALAEAGGPAAVSAAGRLQAVLAISAAALLADPRERVRIKICPADNCGWLFVDETRNGRRRWCSMETCGNRAKARRHYQRSQAARS